MIRGAKTQAIKDIKRELRANGQVFISFSQELDPVIQELVDEQLKLQEDLSHGE